MDERPHSTREPVLARHGTPPKKRLTKRFRGGVGAVIRNSKGQVLALERQNAAGVWKLPQGGLELGEVVEQALFREIHEETGLSRQQPEKTFEVPIWIGYEYPGAGARKGRGQVHKWFFLDIVGDESTTLVEPFRRAVYFELERWAAVADRHVISAAESAPSAES